MAPLAILLLIRTCTLLRIAGLMIEPTRIGRLSPVEHMLASCPTRLTPSGDVAAMATTDLFTRCENPPTSYRTALRQCWPCGPYVVRLVSWSAILPNLAPFSMVPSRLTCVPVGMSLLPSPECRIGRPSSVERSLVSLMDMCRAMFVVLVQHTTVLMLKLLMVPVTRVVWSYP